MVFTYEWQLRTEKDYLLQEVDSIMAEFKDIAILNMDMAMIQAMLFMDACATHGLHTHDIAKHFLISIAEDILPFMDALCNACTR